MQHPRTLLGALLVSIVMAAGFPAPAAAIPLVLFPTDDDRGLDALLDGSYLCCQTDDGITNATITTFEERPALEFALGAVPAGSTISSATLTLFIATAPLVDNTGHVHGYAGDGVITASDLTVDNFLTDFQVTAAGPLTIPLDPSFIQALLDLDEAFAGFALRNVTVPQGFFAFWTVDFFDEELHPRLTLELAETQPIPEPGSIALLVSGLAAGGSYRWRRRH